MTARLCADVAILGRMSTPMQTADLRALPAPEVNRRPRRRHGLVLTLFALAAFVLAGLCAVGLFSDDTQNSPEGMAAFAFFVMGLLLALTGVGLLAAGLSIGLRRPVIRQAAWLEDPSDRTMVRWWDGGAWTAHTSPRDPAVAALAPLVSSSRRRHVRGLALLVGGAVVAVGADLLSHALFEPPAYGPPTADGGPPVDTSSNLWMLVGQATPVAALVAVIGLYLLLTLSDDPRAGWAPDPLDAGRMRWWDGRSWTDLTSAADGGPSVVGPDGAASS